jgi:hypothetical protein
MKIMIRVEDKLNKFQKTPSSYYFIRHYKYALKMRIILSSLLISVVINFSRLDNYYLECKAEQKLSFLIEFLKTHKDKKIIVFFLTCACVDYFWKVIYLYLL